MIPAGLIGIAIISGIALLLAAATARRDGLAQQARDDGEASGRG